MMSITIMGGMWGLFGMLISVPIFAVLYTLVKLAVEKRLAKKGVPTETVEYYAAMEDRTLSESDDEPTFAEKLRKMTADIAENHFGQRFRKFRAKRKEKKAGKDKASTENKEDTENKQ